MSPDRARRKKTSDSGLTICLEGVVQKLESESLLKVVCFQHFVVVGFAKGLNALASGFAVG